ncbi:hypothetical protein E4T39_01796 [Aureobasidium subglaciale]|nr:hypothetical protein E4T39_01796 [Aureobasidium subglaciale]
MRLIYALGRGQIGISIKGSKDLSYYGKSRIVRTTPERTLSMVEIIRTNAYCILSGRACGRALASAEHICIRQEGSSCFAT